MSVKVFFEKGLVKKRDGVSVLFVDNFDSFTYNLVDEFEKRGCSVFVYRNNTPLVKLKSIVKQYNVNLIVISPGPSNPKNAGNTLKVIKEFSGKIPIFGVCLGQQAIVEAFGGRVDKAGEVVHGKYSLISHCGRGVFKGVKNLFPAARYHSLACFDIPSCLEVTANTLNGLVMGVRHKNFQVEGVQFHPESILTSEGSKIIDNVIKMVKGVL